jgi:hypothetical protein
MAQVADVPEEVEKEPGRKPLKSRRPRTNGERVNR